jgi:hypothetical protein
MTGVIAVMPVNRQPVLLHGRREEKMKWRHPSLPPARRAFAGFPVQGFAAIFSCHGWI